MLRLAASKVFGLLVWVKNGLYDRGVLSVCTPATPVISIGNVSVGGNGKTPFSLFLARSLQEQGRRPVILMKGYRGTVRGPHLVSQKDSVKEVGDEALFIALRDTVPVVVAHKKFRGATFIEEHDLGDVIILDDGHQHRALSRKVSVVLIDASTELSIQEFTSGRLLPYGRLREPISSALGRADVVVVTRRCPGSVSEDSLTQLRSHSSGAIPLYRSSLRIVGIFDSLDRAAEPVDRASFREIIAFCGLANPLPFFLTVRELGIKIHEELSFPDHHGFSRTDVEKMRSRSSHVPLLCSEKDFIKVREFGLKDVFYLRVEPQLDAEEELMSFIRKRIS
jgi:tetraacyldisaccharide 4'-kinase